MRSGSKAVLGAVPAQRSLARAVINSSRAFSTSAAAAKLAKILDKELQYEQDNYAELEDTAAFLDESGFEFFEDEDGLNCYLRKEVDGRNIEVQFQARQPPLDHEDQEEEIPEEMQDYYNEADTCDFNVFIYRNGSEDGLVFDCTTAETEITITNIMHTNEISKMRDMHRYERSFNYYNGPEFSSLDERLQAGLSEFLQGHGINEHLAAFVEVMSIDKDNRLYINWLEDMKAFVNP
eukprot:CAMPEP_0197004820 /NCGR_PEP_ID=MMETSP1380-20130617/25823_1 /TAXON_ID=5936 /ORGANISM="Euplotes crassus, Strain CT5" /LENGTH=235 /DNA_ID=CAMNT_0042423747 /DNA_START=50 /DNA_END=757 /DNA_ORIENTATION=+